MGKNREILARNLDCPQKYNNFVDFLLQTMQASLCFILKQKYFHKKDF